MSFEGPHTNFMRKKARVWVSWGHNLLHNLARVHRHTLRRPIQPLQTARWILEPDRHKVASGHTSCGDREKCPVLLLAGAGNCLISHTPQNMVIWKVS